MTNAALLVSGVRKRDTRTAQSGGAKSSAAAAANATVAKSCRISEYFMFRFLKK